MSFEMVKPEEPRKFITDLDYLRVGSRYTKKKNSDIEMVMKVEKDKIFKRFEVSRN